MNVQSLLPKLPDIVAELQHRDADVICCTQTNLKSGTPDRLVSLPGYRLYRQDRTLGRKKAGGGVAVYIRDTLQATRISTPAPPGQSHAETLWLSVKLNKKRATTLGCIYRPPPTTATQADADYNYIEEQLQAVITAFPAHRIALAGDLNSDARTNPAAHRRLLELEERYGLGNVVRQATFYRGDVQSILDVVLLSRELCDTGVPPKCLVEPCHFISHHRRVVLHLSMPRVKPVPVYRTGRNWRAFDEQAFLTDVRDTDWYAAVNRSASCEQQWEAFAELMNNLIDKHAPVRRFRVRNPAPPPISDETLDLMSQRRDALRNDDVDMYQRLNLLTKRAIRKDRRDDIAERVRSATASHMFMQLESVIAPKRGPSVSPVSLSASELNDYFCSIGKSTRDAVMADYERSGRQPLNVRLPRVHTGALNIISVTLDELHRVVISLPNKDSGVPGDVPVKILRLCLRTSVVTCYTLLAPA